MDTTFVAGMLVASSMYLCMYVCMYVCICEWTLHLLVNSI